MPTRVAVMLAALIALAGCTQRIVDRPEGVALDRPGTLLVDLFAGDVSVRIDERVDRVEVQFIRHAEHGVLRQGEAKAALGTIACRVHRLPDAGRPAVEVRASTTDPEPHFLRADVRILAPPLTARTVRTERGDIVVHGIAGPLDVTTSDGDVTVRTTHPVKDPVTIATSNGRIDLRIPGDSRGALDLRTVNGAARVWSPAATVRVEPVTSQDAVQAVLNGGRNPVILRTTNGDIRLQAVEDVMARGDYDG